MEFDSASESIRCYFAYDSRTTRVLYRRDEHDAMNAKIVAKQEPIAYAESRDEINELAYGFLGRHPSRSVHIARFDDEVCETLWCEKYHDELARQASWHAIAWVLMANCLLAFVLTVVLNLSWFGVVAYLGFVVLYLVVVKLGIQNEIEGGLLCTLMLTLTLVCFSHVSSNLREHRSPETAVVGTSEHE